MQHGRRPFRIPSSANAHSSLDSTGMASPWSPDENIEDEVYDRAGGEEGVVSVQSRALVATPTAATPQVAPSRAAAARVAAAKLVAAASKRKRTKASGKDAETSGKRTKASGKDAETSGRPAKRNQPASEANAAEQPPVNPPRAPAPKQMKSPAWNDFKRIESSADEVIAECLICHAILKGHSKNGTSHLLRHARNMHPTNSNAVDNYFLNSDRNDDGSYALKNSKFDHETLRIAISLFLLGGSHPFSVVEEYGYRSMMAKACPHFKNISRYTIKRDIMAMFVRDRREEHAAGKTFMIPMLKDMKEKFDKYWSDYSVFLSCAAVLDPRYKLGFISYCYNKLYEPAEAERRIAEVKTTLVNLFNEYKGFSASKFSSDGAGTSTSGGGADMFNDYESFISTSQIHEEKSQLDLYLEEPARKLNEKLDILEYWCKSSMRYPELAAMARDILAVPVSSVASESAFSMSRKVITPNRSSLKPKTVEAIMCLQDWYRSKWQKGDEKEEQAQSSNANPDVYDLSSDSD